MDKATQLAITTLAIGGAAAGSYYLLQSQKRVVIAEGDSLEAFHSTGIAETLPHGTPFEIIIEVPGWIPEPLIRIADLAGAEHIVRRFREEAGAILIDVEAIGHTVVLHYKANFAVTAGVVALVVASFIGISFLIASIRMEAPGTVVTGFYDTIKWIVIGALIVAVLFYLTQAKLIARAA